MQSILSVSSENLTQLAILADRISDVTITTNCLAISKIAETAQSEIKFLTEQIQDMKLQIDGYRALNKEIPATENFKTVVIEIGMPAGNVFFTKIGIARIQIHQHGIQITPNFAGTILILRERQINVRSHVNTIRETNSARHVRN